MTTTVATSENVGTITTSRASLGKVLLVNLGATVAAGATTEGLGRDRAGRGRASRRR